MKNNKGFTLVEIIITLAIVITITTVAVSSYIGISSQKKKEEWKLVQGQIETAAEQYFSSNKYLYEGLTDDITAYISVGTLVKSDYLNKVVNPISKKEVPSCSLVTVKIENGKYIGKYDEKEDTKESDETSCDTDNKVVVKEPGAPNFELKGVCEDINGNEIGNNADGWCYKKDFSIEKLKKNGIIISSKTCNGQEINCVPNTDFSLTDKISGFNDTSENAITAVSISNQRATTIIYDGYKIDRTPPYGNVTLSRNDGEAYNSARPKITINANDDHSGIYSAGFGFAQDKDKVSYWEKINLKKWNPVIYYSYIYKGPYATNPYLNGSGETVMKGAIQLNVTDKVGNVGFLNNNQYTLYTNCTDKFYSVSNGSWSSCSKACNTGTRTRTNTTYVTDKYTNVVCPGNGTTSSETGYCNTQSCCSRTEEYGDTTWGSYTACNKNNNKTKNGTKNLRSAYDHSTYCGTTNKSHTTSCSTSSVKCDISEIETDCKSSVGNHILGRLKVKCDHAIKEIRVHYYYKGGNSSICNGVSSSTAVNDIHGGSWTTGGDAKNTAYFNFRGCGSTKLRYQVIVTTLDGSTKTYKPDDNWYDFNFSSSKSYSACSPGAGGRWE